ncbi:unnamed protein product [Schistocephalus solidus]|uniref:Uncharacterized protein n=1 Tax=Schistocephalus solidus TaxID=70667 RepID=A0A3P7DE85_SCHSO|nr:unnamed protein product [Schistocephalus solidus]
MPSLVAGRPKPARKTVSTKILVSDDGERVSGPVTSEGLYDVPASFAKPVDEPPAEEVTRPQPLRIPGYLPPGTLRHLNVEAPVLQGAVKSLKTRPKTQPVEDKPASEPEWMRVRRKLTASRKISQSSLETPTEAVQEEPSTIKPPSPATTDGHKRDLPQLKPS